MKQRKQEKMDYIKDLSQLSPDLEQATIINGTITRNGNHLVNVLQGEKASIKLRSQLTSLEVPKTTSRKTKIEIVFPMNDSHSTPYR